MGLKNSTPFESSKRYDKPVMDRRRFLAATLSPLLLDRLHAAPKLRVTGMEFFPVRATDRTVWMIVRLRTDQGLTGLGEASDAFGYANTTKEQAQRMETELRRFYGLMEGKSPLDVMNYRERGEAWAIAGGLVSATAYSAIEQAMWDLAGQALGVPTYDLFGGKIRDRVPIYANINRATQPRTPEGFASTARRAVAEGFRAVKGAPFDGFPPPGSPPETIKRAVDQGIAAVAAMRDSIGGGVQLMVDCHSFFDVRMAVDVARRIESQDLTWYEEPVAPERIEDTLEIKRGIKQSMAAGEILFGTKGFAALCRRKAVSVIMPDVKHCGGLLEMTYIAAMARDEGVEVAPHNPSGPVSMAASVQMSACMPNFLILELQWGEVPWRSELVNGAERIERGSMQVPDAPGLGIQLNDKLALAHPV